MMGNGRILFVIMETETVSGPALTAAVKYDKEVSEDGKTAEGTFCLVCMITMIENGEKDAYILIGKYSNKYVKVDGKCLFAELTDVIDQTAPWDKGWVKAAITKEIW